MEDIFKLFIIPLLIGVIASVIAARLSRGDSDSKESPNFRVILGTGVIVAILVAIGASQFLAPYKVISTNWCLKDDESVQVNGRLATLILGSPVADYPVQIKIFQTGEKVPLKGPNFDTTEVDGTFKVEFSPPAPATNKSYLINTAYSYDTAVLGERWKIRDFRKGYPPTCSN